MKIVPSSSFSEAFQVITENILSR